MADGKSKPGRSADKQTFYVFGPDVRGGGRGHGLIFENENMLRTPPRLFVRPPEGGFPSLREKPRIVFDRKRGRPPRDLELAPSGYWFVSQRLKETLDLTGARFRQADKL